MAKNVFQKENIKLGASFQNKDEAIIAAGTLLVDNGYVTKEYIDDMIARDQLVTTYIGNGLAIPHGVANSESHIIESGISFIQVPEGVAFVDGVAKLIIGIAGKNNTHLDMLARIATLCSQMEIVDKLIAAKTEEEVLQIFNGAF